MSAEPRQIPRPFPTRHMGGHLGFVKTTWTCQSTNSRNAWDQSVSRRNVCRVAIAAIAVANFRSFPVLAAQRNENEMSNMSKKLFADAMETGMVQYEANIAARKRELFNIIKSSDNVLDVGIGAGPNLRFLPAGTHVTGVDPNPYMNPYAMEKANASGINLEQLEGVCENLPVESNCYDVAISTLTLCSVKSPSKAIKEIIRVLKPGGYLIFIEHVYAPSSRPLFRVMQTVLNPLQNALADGCNLNRNTASYLREAKDPGFSEINYTDFEVHFGGLGDVLNPIQPHIAGLARK